MVVGRASLRGPPTPKEMGEGGGNSKGDEEGEAREVGGEPEEECPGSPVKKVRVLR